jgi:acyl-coenzyme A thioesterase PaaI-like protein
MAHPVDASAGSDRAERGLQERYAPDLVCFGCGPANPKGLRIRSIPRDGDVVLRWRGEPHHDAWPGYLSGGIAGTLVDCHMNWTAAYHLMRTLGRDRPPTTVTAEYAITLLRPIPSGGEIEVVARVIDSTNERATVEATLSAGGKDCARARGTFVAVKEGHPAFHRW